MREYGYVYEDKRCKITVKFGIQNNPQPSPLSELVRNTAENFEKIKSIRSRLGVSVTYLESVLSLGDLVKEVSRSERSFHLVLNGPLDSPRRQDNYWIAIWRNQGALVLFQVIVFGRRSG